MNSITWLIIVALLGSLWIMRGNKPFMACTCLFFGVVLLIPPVSTLDQIIAIANLFVFVRWWRSKPDATPDPEN